MNKQTKESPVAAEKIAGKNVEETAPALPFFQREIARLQKDFDRIVDRFWGDEGLTLPDFPSMLTPDTDQSEDDKAYHVSMEVPGLDDNDIEVTYADGMLTIKGEKKAESETHEKNYYRKERSYGSFQRTFPVTGAVNEDAIEAHVAKGVLSVTLPKLAGKTKQTRKIAVKKA